MCEIRFKGIPEANLLYNRSTVRITWLNMDLSVGRCKCVCECVQVICIDPIFLWFLGNSTIDDNRRQMEVYCTITLSCLLRGWPNSDLFYLNPNTLRTKAPLFPVNCGEGSNEIIEIICNLFYLTFIFPVFI